MTSLEEHFKGGKKGGKADWNYLNWVMLGSRENRMETIYPPVEPQTHIPAESHHNMCV